MLTNELIAVALVFAVGLLIVVGIYSLINDLWGGVRGQVRRRVALEAQQRLPPPSRELFRNLEELTQETWDEDRAVAEPWRVRLQRMITQAGLPLSVERLLARCGGLAIIGALLAAVVTWSWVASLLTGLVGALLPPLHVLYHRHQRQDRLRAQLGDAFQMMARVMRAGQSTAHALRLVSEEMPEPVSGEFGACYEHQNLGIAPVAAYRDLARRTGLFEIKMFVVAMLVHREAGGNLAELLEQLAAVIRERYRLAGVVRTLTAEGRFQAAILLALPIVLFGLLMAIQPGYVTVMFAYPWLFVVAAVLELLGAFWIRRVVHFDL